MSRPVVASQCELARHVPVTAGALMVSADQPTTIG
jgi:hypothetical protein